jgi:Phospholipase_D-nuclease N-terminal
MEEASIGILGAGIIITVIVLWVLCIKDIISREMSTGGRITWFLVVFLFPVFGSCIYLLTHTSASAMASPGGSGPWYAGGGGPPVA